MIQKKRGRNIGEGSVQLRDWRFQGCCFLTVEWYHQLGVPITGEPVLEVPFTEEPALGFSFADKLADLTHAFRESALENPLLWEETALKVSAR